MSENKIDKDISLFLPYDLKKHPSYEGIKTWSSKKYKTMKYLSYFCLFCALLQLFDFDFDAALLDNIVSILIFVLFISMAVGVNYQKKKYILSEKNIQSIISYYESKNN